MAHTEVVPSAIVFRIDFGASVVHLSLLLGIVAESSAVEKFVYGKRLRIAVVSLFDFGIALANDVNRSGEARVAELRKDFLSELVEYRRHVADFAFANFRVFVH